MLPSCLFKTKCKIDEKFNAKGIQNNNLWNDIAKGYWENKAVLNLPNIFGKKLFTLLENITKFPQGFFKSSFYI